MLEPGALLEPHFYPEAKLNSYCAGAANISCSCFQQLNCDILPKCMRKLENSVSWKEVANPPGCLLPPGRHGDGRG